MARAQKNVSIPQILLISYLTVAIPAVLFAYHMVKSIDDELAMHVEMINSGDHNSVSRRSEILVSLGAILREHSVPFSNTHNNAIYDEDDQLSSTTENLRNVRAAIIYGWIFLITGGTLAYFTLSTNLHRIFKGLVEAIDSLRKHDFNDKIRLESPYDVSDISKSLENLRLKMTHEEVEQQRFLRHISHEIKTPLTSIVEGSKLLDDQMLGTMNEEQREITSILVRSGKELQSAVENLLDYNAAVSLKPANQRRPLDLAELIRQALSNNELPIKQKQLTVNTRLSPCHGNVDQSQILTVFDNLISNAVKHSPFKGTISIKLEKNQSSDIIFLIRDQGLGVKEQDKKRIFEPFYVGAQASETTLKGTGLGLSIAKQYIEEHRGELNLVTSQKGAIFKIVLPSN